MSATERDEYLRKYGHLPISGGSGEDEDDLEDLTDEDDEDDEDEDDTWGEDGKKRAATKSPPDRTFSQAQVNRMVKRRAAREAQKLLPDLRKKVEEELRKSGDESENERELIRLRRELEDKETLEAMVLEYDELAEERYERALATLPDFIQDMAPDDDAPAIEKERWLTQKALPAKERYEAKGGDKSKDDEQDEAKRKRRGFNPKDPDKGTKDTNRVKKLTEQFRSTGEFRRM